MVVNLNAWQLGGGGGFAVFLEGTRGGWNSWDNGLPDFLCRPVGKWRFCRNLIPAVH